MACRASRFWEFSGAMAADVRVEIAALEKQSRAITVSRALVLLDLVRQFHRSGIPVLVLKGPAIGIAAYGDCSRRVFADADLLVRRTDLGHARNMPVSYTHLRAHETL